MQVYVVDTNVVVAGLITGAAESPVASILDAMLSGASMYLLSAELLTEYRSGLLRPRIARLHGLTIAEVDLILVELTANAIWLDPESGAAAPDRGDDHLWALLAGRKGSILITGDRILQDNPPNAGSVISPKAWESRGATK